MLRFLVSLLVTLCLVYPKINCESSGCENPLGKKGSCINLQKCESLATMMRVQPTSEANLFFLQKSICGIEPSNLQYKVCCTDNGISSSTVSFPNTLTTSTTEQPISSSELDHSYTVDNENKESTTSTESPREILEKLKYHKNIQLLPQLKTCGYSVASDRIIGGSAAGLGTYPWMVLIGYKDLQGGPLQYGCGGTLISSRYVLTAAHCVTGKNIEGFSLELVKVGEYDQSKAIDCDDKGLCAPPPQLIPIEKSIPHENYNKEMHSENDIALIRLSKTVALGPFVAPVCLPVDVGIFKSMLMNNSMLYVAGWGRTKWNSEANSDILQDVQVPVVPEKNCIKIYKSKYNFDTLGPGRLCAGGEKSKDSCHGDSGGPMMQTLSVASIRNQPRTFQFGIVSMGPSEECGASNMPSLYTRVTYYMEWILDHLKP